MVDPMTATRTVPYPNHATPEQVAGEVLGVLGSGDCAVLLAGWRNRGKVEQVTRLVARDHPGAVLEATRQGSRLRVFAWPASVDADRSVWFYEP